MQDFQEDFYLVLGVEEASTPEEIRKAYLKLAKRLHPDRFPNDPEKRAEAQTEFSKVTRAHELLSDAKQREEYDALRTLAKNKMAIDAGEPSIVQASTSTEQKVENRDSWAQKHSGRALDLLNRKKFPEAETAIKEAIRLSPSNAVYYATLADIHLARGWRTLAQEAVKTALKIDPKNHEAKTVELKLKATAGKTGNPKDMKNSGNQKETKREELTAASGKKGFLDQLKELLNKKI